MDVTKQVAVVTGGASGMGKACAELLTKQGAQVAVWDQKPSDPDHFSCDVSSATEVENALLATIDRFGVPRICVNCAGIAPAKKIVGKEGAMELEAFKRVIEINLIGTFNVMRLIAAEMMKLEPLASSQERGVFVNTASIAAYEGQIGQTAYSASKGGVVSMTLPAAREFAKYGIRVNTIAPGLVATPLLLNMPQEVQDSLITSIPFPKRFGHPEEFAFLVMHIIQNCLLNGEVIRLDGALRMSPT